MRSLVALAAVALALSFAAPAHAAAERAADGMFHTGAGIRIKKVAFVKIKVYAIDHYMKELPAQKTRQAVIDADTDKRFAWKMLRSVDGKRIKSALREAFEMNGYKDEAKIAPFVEALGGELKEGAEVSIRYDAATKKTTLTGPSGSASATGVDFMKAVWSVWLGKIDQPELGDELIGKL